MLRSMESSRERTDVNRRHTIPHAYVQLDETGRLDAYQLSWKPGDANPPHKFWDSDVAKWVEAASDALQARPDKRLRALVNQATRLICSAQQPDGYLNAHYTVVEPELRWKNLRDNHELYCAGHLIEAAVAHYQATGEQAFLDVMRGYADLIDSLFGRSTAKKRGYPGHEEIELALVKLYRSTGEKRYQNLAEFFILEKGRKPHYYDRESRERGEAPAPKGEGSGRRPAGLGAPALSDTARRRLDDLDTPRRPGGGQDRRRGTLRPRPTTGARPHPCRSRGAYPRRRP